MNDFRLLAVLLLLTGTSGAQESDRIAYVFDHVALSVADAEVSKGFYVDLFGMTNITDREPIEGVRWLSMPGGGELHLLAIVEGNCADQPGRAPRGQGQVSGFRYLARADRTNERRVHDLAWRITRCDRA